MKKIPLWQVIVLSIITLGIYQLYWLAVQKKYVEKSTSTKLPSTGWLVSVGIGYIPLFIAAVVLGLLPTSNDLSTLLAILLLACFVMAVSSYTTVVYIWWSIMFMRGAEKVLAPRFTLVWMIIHLFTTGLGVIIMQYYANRKPRKSQTQPSKRFVTLSIIAIVLPYVIGLVVGIAVILVAIQSQGVAAPTRSISNTEYRL